MLDVGDAFESANSETWGTDMNVALSEELVHTMLHVQESQRPHPRYLSDVQRGLIEPWMREMVVQFMSEVRSGAARARAARGVDCACVRALPPGRARARGGARAGEGSARGRGGGARAHAPMRGRVAARRPRARPGSHPPQRHQPSERSAGPPRARSRARPCLLAARRGISGRE